MKWIVRITTVRKGRLDRTVKKEFDDRDAAMACADRNKGRGRVGCVRIGNFIARVF